MSVIKYQYFFKYEKTFDNINTVYFNSLYSCVDLKVSGVKECKKYFELIQKYFFNVYNGKQILETLEILSKNSKTNTYYIMNIYIGKSNDKFCCVKVTFTPIFSNNNNLENTEDANDINFLEVISEMESLLRFEKKEFTINSLAFLSDHYSI